MEWTIHNGVMSGMGLDGQSWYYRNPLRREAGYRAAGHNDMSQRESPGAARICCPSNMIRTIAELHTYFYGISPGGVWLNLYGASEFAHQWEPGDEIAIEQKTDYPWDGRIEIEIRKAPARPIFIQARIPSWAKGARIEINGQPAEAAAAPGAYARIERAWKPGDRIALDFPMQPRLLQGHPKAEHIRNQAAVARGPILYCLEAPDLPRGRELHNVYLPLNPQFQPTAAADMPFGIRALEGKALYRAEAAWADDLYRPIEEAPFEPMPLRLIPYFAWANRGEQAMSVWLPLAWREA
ncbi:MAG: Non-reducing end beta-L-arabinofuranosidase [candidate division BRC1 bacterium ADurb.BinA364]|nr:MAG: Non-reducing end beta-L-arabinofuranosidase [candidate division BRC1 bacterium ADurb.BinA364]